ncbi:hypothetical protein Tco_1274849 [Tanacetum coccineum]
MRETDPLDKLAKNVPKENALGTNLGYKFCVPSTKSTWQCGDIEDHSNSQGICAVVAIDFGKGSSKGCKAARLIDRRGYADFKRKQMEFKSGIKFCLKFTLERGRTFGNAMGEVKPRYVGPSRCRKVGEVATSLSFLKS